MKFDIGCRILTNDTPLKEKCVASKIILQRTILYFFDVCHIVETFVLHKHL